MKSATTIFQALLFLLAGVSCTTAWSQIPSGPSSLYSLGSEPPRLTADTEVSTDPKLACKPDPTRSRFDFSQPNFSSPDCSLPDSIPPRKSTFEIVGGVVRRGKRDIFTDFKHLYTKDNALNFGAVLLGAGILANTKGDLRFQEFYHEHIGCNFTSELSEFTKIFGEGKIFIPVTVSASFLYEYCLERDGAKGRRRPAGDFFYRVGRGYAVGTPALLAGQFLLGANRPRDGSSYWKPFQQDHGISGHAYIGAIPFITAAQMSDKLWMKGIFYTLSVIPAWSRVNDDAHYLSQAVLGWYLAYLSVRAVSETEGLKPLPKGLTLFPITEGDCVGIGFLYKR